MNKIDPKKKGIWCLEINTPINKQYMIYSNRKMCVLTWEHCGEVCNLA